MALSPIESFDYTRDWTKPADFPTFEDDETVVREDMQFQPNELKTFINNVLVAFINTELIPLVDAMVAGTITPDSVYTAAIQKGAVTLEKLAADVTAKALGAPDKVNGVAADASGNIKVTGEKIPMSASDATTLTRKINAKQTMTQSLTAETALADDDYVPFYDTSASANRKTLWSNIVAKIRAAFKTTALPVDSGGTGAADAAKARANLGITPANIGALSSTAGAVGTTNLGSKVVTAAKVADGTLTREKMAADVLGVPSEARNNVTPFDAYCNGRLLVVAPSEDKNFTLTADDVAALPDGFSVTIVRGQAAGAYKISWSGIDVLNLNDRRMMWNAAGYGSGSISLKTVGDSVTITKWANISRIIIQGNTHVRNIYDGTSATPPSTWMNGDIYLQYQ